MRLFVAMAHFDPQGIVAPHVRRQILALKSAAERVVVVSTANLCADDEQWLRSNAQLVRRENYGYDFLSYRTGLLEGADLTQYDRVVVCNDSFVGPLVNYSDVFDAMDDHPSDFWGMTRSQRIRQHVQSFFVCFPPWVVRSQAFKRFWRNMSPLSDRREVILRYEVGLTQTLEEAGFASGSYFTESPADIELARRRMRWWAWLRVQNVPCRKRRDLFMRRAREAWNPCIGLADAALGDSRLPLVKIDTLRHDPYGLDAQRLLRACEKAMPDQFRDVRAFLDRTAKFYPTREGERLPAPSPLARPFHSLVRYA